MAIPQIPVNATETVTHRRRVAESINDIISFRFDQSRAITEAEAVSGENPVNLAYEPGDTRRWGVTDSTSATFNTAALLKALSTSDIVTVYGATYDPVTISSSNKFIRMLPGVVFKLPNSTVVVPNTSGPHVVDVTGANVTIYGDFEIDGNKANNVASSFTSGFYACLHVSGDHLRINGTLTIRNAYWRGVCVENGSNTGDEVDGFYCESLYFIEPYSYALMLWTAENFHINTIRVSRGTKLDARIRIGTQTSSSGQAKNGYIGSIFSNSTVAFESGALACSIGIIKCAVFKFQDSTDCSVDYIYADYSTYSQNDVEAIGIAFATSERCHISYGHVANYNCTTQNGAIVISGATNCSADHLSVAGTVASGIRDMMIRTVDGMNIGQIVLDSSGTHGFIYDIDTAGGSYQPQRDLVIGSLISRGHGTDDVELDSSGTGRAERLSIGYINPDAVIATGGGALPFGTFQWGTGTASATVNNGHVNANSIVSVIPKDANAAAIVANPGYYITCASGNFTINTAAGNTAANSNWNYVVHSQFTPTA